MKKNASPSDHPFLLALVFLVLAALLLLHIQHYANFLSDDALISLRYARRLVAGYGLTWTGTERVEGYTNFLWVLLTAAGTALGFDTIATALTLDKLGAFLALTFLGLSPTTGRLSWRRWLVGGAVWVASIPVAVWSNGGLEHGFMMGILTLALFRLIQRAQEPPPSLSTVLWDGLPLAALALLRADGILLGFFLLLGSALAPHETPRRKGLPRLIKTFAVPVVALALQMLFRRLYYGTFQPNTAVAKLNFNLDRLVLGLTYLRDGGAAMAVLVVAAIAATVYLARQQTKAAILIPWTLVLGWSLYLVSVGGDIFPGWRQLLFVFPPLAMVLAEFGERFNVAGLARRSVFFGALTLGIGIAHFLVQSINSENRRAKQELWEWDGLSIGHLLQQAFATQQPLLAVDAAGALPYWSNLPSLDMLGLNDAYIAHHPPPNFGHGPIGHELGDGLYVLSRRPDIIAFNNASGHHVPAFLSGIQLIAMPLFHKEYQWIRVQGTQGNQAMGELWLRRENGRLGIVREPYRILVPGYFLTGQHSDAIARLDPNHRLVAWVTSHAPGVLSPFTIPMGHWRLKVNSDATDLAIDIRCDGRSMEGPTRSKTVVIQGNPKHGFGLAMSPTHFSTQPRSITSIEFLKADDLAPTHRCAPPNLPLPIRLEDLAHPKPAALFWAHPENFILDSHGLRILLDKPRTFSRVKLSGDNNDRYEVRLIRENRLVWVGKTPLLPAHAGLTLHTLDLPNPIPTLPGDTLDIVPVEGDGSYSIGHLILE